MQTTNLFSTKVLLFQEPAVHTGRLIYFTSSTVEKLWGLSLALTYQEKCFLSLIPPRSWTQQAPSPKQDKQKHCASFVFTCFQELFLSCRTKQLRFAMSCPVLPPLSLTNLICTLWRKDEMCWYRGGIPVSAGKEAEYGWHQATKPRFASAPYTGDSVSVRRSGLERHYSYYEKVACLRTKWSILSWLVTDSWKQY